MGLAGGADAVGVGEGGGGVGRAAREGVHVMVRGKFMNKLVRLTAFAYSNSIYRLSYYWDFHTIGA